MILIEWHGLQRCYGPVLGLFVGGSGAQKGDVLGAFLHELTVDTDMRYVPVVKQGKQVLSSFARDLILVLML